MEFPKDEVKNKIVWTKGADFTDGSPRYTFEGRDPATTYERFQVVIYTERERRYAHDPGSLCNHYYRQQRLQSRVRVYRRFPTWRQTVCSVADQCPR